MEGLLYETCKSAGMTLITISTRLSLKKYHTYQLTLGTRNVGRVGEGQGWEFDRIGTESERRSVERELEELKAVLKKMDGLEKRKEVVERELKGLGIAEGGQDGKEDSLSDSIVEVGIDVGMESQPDLKAAPEMPRDDIPSL